MFLPCDPMVPLWLSGSWADSIFRSHVLDFIKAFFLLCRSLCWSFLTKPSWRTSVVHSCHGRVYWTGLFLQLKCCFWSLHMHRTKLGRCLKNQDTKKRKINSSFQHGYFLVEVLDKTETIFYLVLLLMLPLLGVCQIWTWNFYIRSYTYLLPFFCSLLQDSSSLPCVLPDISKGKKKHQPVSVRVLFSLLFKLTCCLII